MYRNEQQAIHEMVLQVWDSFYITHALLVDWSHGFNKVSDSSNKNKIFRPRSYCLYAHFLAGFMWYHYCHHNSYCLSITPVDYVEMVQDKNIISTI